MGGFIKLHRGWQDSELFSDKEVYCERMAWLWLIENAAWKDTTRYNYKHEMIDIKRGQIHISLASLEKSFGWSKKKIRGFLVRLEKRHMVVAERAQSGTVLTICNYAKYQDKPDDKGHSQGTAKGTVRAQSGHTQEEGIRKDKKEKKASKEAMCISNVNTAVDGWNEHAKQTGAKQIRGLSDKRRAKLKLRLAEQGLGGWQEALNRALRSEMLGRDPPQWFKFDFLIENETNILKLLEGNYDRKFNNGNGGNRTLDAASEVAEMVAARNAKRAANNGNGSDSRIDQVPQPGRAIGYVEG